MANFRYLPLNLALIATLTASPAVNAAYPQTNTQRTERTLVCRSTSLASQQHKYSWTTNQTINMVSLWYHNLTAGATWRVQVFSDSAFTTSIYDSGTVTAFPYTGISANAQLTSDEFRIFKSSAMYFASLTTAKSLIITIVDAANPFGYTEFSHAFIGRYSETSTQCPWGGAQVTVINTTVNERAEDMSNTSDKGGTYAVVTINHDWLQESDREDLQTAISECGSDRLMWVSIYPTDGTSKEMRHQHAVKIKDASPIDPYMYGTLQTRITFDGN